MVEKRPAKKRVASVNRPVWVGQLGEEDVLRAHDGAAGDNCGTAQLGIPEHGIDHVMKTDGTAQTHEEAVEEGSDYAGRGDSFTCGDKQLLKRRPDDVEHSANKDGGKACDDGYEARSAKESQHLRQLNVLVAIV